jgi:hypothetical protein
MSDWGSAFPGQEVVYTIVLRNDRPATEDTSGTLNDVTIRSSLPRNLDVQSAAADRGNDPTIAGNDIRYSVGSLKPGEAIELKVYTSIKDKVDIGTILVAQSEAEFDNLSRALLSNIATVEVVGQAEQQAMAATAYPSPATSPSPQPTATRSAAATGTPRATSTSRATSTTAPQVGVGAYPTEEPKRNTVRTNPDGTLIPLPATSTGVPLAGFALLGMTLLIRTVRLHRERERI